MLLDSFEVISNISDDLYNAIPINVNNTLIRL